MRLLLAIGTGLALAGALAVADPFCWPGLFAGVAGGVLIGVGLTKGERWGERRYP